ncbi:unnamed protein product [Clonostachys rhizophaga]|uniref:Uncharacterized protein n=1 Tax=Clonostachys rhizophaga TaxID=160324 RepID=A0A9N9YEX4_9HYPO|nr:unnamed protein product [Clonostachys rhizophaga]
MKKHSKRTLMTSSDSVVNGIGRAEILGNQVFIVLLNGGNQKYGIPVLCKHRCKTGFLEVTETCLWKTFGWD